MHIAIIGGGFSGLATAWHFLQHAEIKVDIFDPAGIGGGASSIAAGLLHTFAGLHAKRNLMADEGVQAARELLNHASHMLGTPVYSSSGLLRPAMSEANQRDYALCAEKYPQDVQWWSTEQCQKNIVGYPEYPGLYIPLALTVNSENYLKGLWLACQAKGAQLRQEEIRAFDCLKNYAAIAICTGASSLPFFAQKLPITAVKGQILVLEWPSDCPPLAIPLNSQAYIIMQPDNKTCIVGSTYERHFTTVHPEVDVASREIMPKVAAMYPPLKEAKIVGCRAGVRASTPDHLPLLKQLDPRTWILSGMGSKGLLYHALYAKKLAKQILVGCLE